MGAEARSITEFRRVVGFAAGPRWQIGPLALRAPRLATAKQKCPQRGTWIHLVTRRPRSGRPSLRTVHRSRRTFDRSASRCGQLLRLDRLEGRIVDLDGLGPSKSLRNLGSLLALVVGSCFRNQLRLNL